jgi:hypothetical protein
MRAAYTKGVQKRTARRGRRQRMKQYTVKEIADSITKMDSTSPVDALAELMRRHPRSKTAGMVCEWMYEGNTGNEEHDYQALAENLRVGRSPEVYWIANNWVDPSDYQRYVEILREITEGQEDYTADDLRIHCTNS